MSKSGQPTGIRIGAEIRNHPGSRAPQTTSLPKPPKK